MIKTEVLYLPYVDVGTHGSIDFRNSEGVSCIMCRRSNVIRMLLVAPKDFLIS
jgi:hypothetical protein